MSVKPITPRQMVSKKLAQIPDIVIMAFNNLITKHWNGMYSVVRQEDAIEEIILYSHETNKDKARAKIFAEGWLDVESIYEKFGWSVTYDEPGYYEDYPTTFTFRPKNECRQAYIWTLGNC